MVKQPHPHLVLCLCHGFTSPQCSHTSERFCCWTLLWGGLFLALSWLKLTLEKKTHSTRGHNTGSICQIADESQKTVYWLHCRRRVGQVWVEQHHLGSWQWLVALLLYKTWKTEAQWHIETDYTAFASRNAPSADNSPSLSPIIFLHNPAKSLPEPPAYQNTCYYIFHSRGLPLTLGEAYNFKGLSLMNCSWCNPHPCWC